jgi:tRNA(Ile)-lysidine synthetase-like protein
MVASYSYNFDGLWSLADHKLSEFIVKNQRVALGVSGGADSVGLFYVFCDFIKQKKISDLVVFHINFGLRGAESDGDEVFVRGLCHQQNVKIRVFKPDAPLSASIQESAREFRLGVQREFTREGFIIALAHSSDDVAENIILRLARGSAIENAAGMTHFDGSVFRPWLEAPRSLIRKAMQDKGYTWRDDSSNDESYYTRNKIRHEVLPVIEKLFPGASERITKSFLTLPASSRNNGFTAGQKIPISVFAVAARSNIDRLVHEYLEASYGGKSPVPRQVVSQISAAIHKISTGLDGQSRDFSLPGGRTLKLSPTEMTLEPSL